jgi:hypothetical protein
VSAAEATGSAGCVGSEWTCIYPCWRTLEKPVLVHLVRQTLIRLTIEMSASLPVEAPIAKWLLPEKLEEVEVDVEKEKRCGRRQGGNLYF